MEDQMSTKLNSKGVIAAHLIIIAALLFSISNLFANGSKENFPKPKEIKNARTIETLKTGIQSDNIGLKKCSIYFAGLYEVHDVVDALTSQLKKEKDPEIKTLIALSLFRIGDEKGYKTIKSLAEKDNNPKVKRICSDICKEFNKVVNSKIVQINNTKN